MIGRHGIEQAVLLLVFLGFVIELIRIIDVEASGSVGT